MKKSLLIVLLACPLFLFLGAHWHPALLSMVDGVVELKHESQVEEFEIDPEFASFIFHDLIGNGGAWGEHTGTAYVFVDDESYYFVKLRDPMPEGRFGPFSWYAKRFATRISGRDGAVFDRGFNEWKPEGYLHYSKAEFVSNVTTGMYDLAVEHAVGPPFSKTISDVFEWWGYWCKDGEVSVHFFVREVRSINTNRNVGGDRVWINQDRSFDTLLAGK
ncbi:MAG: hypothetical protein HQ559_18405 [Lentisphaerae bacterium]|nr:hypothetical protein [Lentisphaerota bacterium]